MNRDTIYENKNLFPWLIESIFYFFDKENHKNIETKVLIEGIQKNLLILYKELFMNKKLKDDFFKMIRKN